MTTGLGSQLRKLCIENYQGAPNLIRQLIDIEIGLRRPKKNQSLKDMVAARNDDS